MSDITDVDTAVISEVTPDGEEPENGVEVAQETDAVEEFRVQIAAMERRLEAEAESKVELDRQRRDAEKRAEELDRRYKGLQKENTPKLQELSRLKTQLENTSKLDGRLAKIERLVEAMSSQYISQEDRDRLELQLERERLAAEREELIRAAQEAAQIQTNPQPEYVDPEIRKRQLLTELFPDTVVDIDNPRIDWAEDASDYAAWQARFVRSVRTLEREVERQELETERESARRAAEETTRAAREEVARVTKEAREGATRATEEAREAARLEKEARLRELGADVNPTAVPEASNATGRSLDEQYPIDPRWLTGSPEERTRYNQNLMARQRAIRGVR